MQITYKTKLYCLIGNPIEKSLSPIIHNSIFKSLNEDSIYLAFNIKENDLKNTIEAFKAMKIQGFNVTIPHKKTIIEYLDVITPEAKVIGAVNTVKNENGILVGYNTDGDGFLQTFYDNNIDIKNKNILILGSGGAAFAIGSILAIKEVQSIYIASRNTQNCILLKEKINLINNNIKTETTNLSLDNIDKKSIDIIINATSLGMYPMENMSPIELNGFPQEVIVYDIVYKPKETKLIKEAKSKNIRTLGGISMLLNQAILSQNIWLNLDKSINVKIIEEVEGLLGIYVE